MTAVTACPGFIYDKVAVLRDKIEGTLCIRLYKKKLA